MRAIQISEFSNGDNLKLVELPIPQPQSGEIVIQSHACGVNPIDWKTCRGGGAAPFIGDLPFIPGWELSGTVSHSDRQGFKVGERVAGFLRFPQPAGCYAEYVCAPTDQIARIPDEVSFEEAAALPLAGLTAWQALFDKGQLQSGERVLILAAAGGVGHLATQLAASAGAVVVATASSANHAWLHQLGASMLIDYHQQEVSDSIDNIDLIIDCVGGETAVRALRCAKAGGRVVTLPSVTKDQVIEAGKQLGVSVQPIRAEPNGAQLSELLQRVAKKELSIEICKCYPLEEIANAFAESAEGHTRGKRLLLI